MKVKEWMERKLITIDRKTTIPEAISLMKRHSIRHLPVVEGGSLVGLVTEGDMRQVFIASLIEELSIDDVMIKNPITISPEAEIEDAAKVIHYKKIGGLPVIDDDKRLVGIITVADIMAAFIELMGILKSSSRIDLVLGHDPEAFEKVSKIISSLGGKIISVGMTPLSSDQKNLYFFRLEKCRVGKIVRALENEGYQVMSSME